MMRLVSCRVPYRVAIVVCCVLGSGCERGGIPRYPVSGTVTFNGQPVAEGDIMFLPEQPSLGPDAALIRAGKYAFEATAGKKRVEIRARKRLPGVPPGPMNVPATKAYIPDRYNAKSELTVEVIADGKNEFSFDLLGE